MKIQEKHKSYNIVFFDGVCNFCNSTVDKIYCNNRKRNIYYSSLQSEFAKEFLGEYGINTNDLDTIIFYSAGKFYFRSSAVLEISKLLKGYKIFSIFLLVPVFIRDAVYKWFARNRYKFFGKKETCRIPSVEEKEYFLE